MREYHETGFFATAHFLILCETLPEKKFSNRLEGENLPGVTLFHPLLTPPAE